jgi:hypothetical protein
MQNSKTHQRLGTGAASATLFLLSLSLAGCGEGLDFERATLHVASPSPQKAELMIIYENFSIEGDSDIPPEADEEEKELFQRANERLLAKSQDQLLKLVFSPRYVALEPPSSFLGFLVIDLDSMSKYPQWEFLLDEDEELDKLDEALERVFYSFYITLSDNLTIHPGRFFLDEEGRPGAIKYVTLRNPDKVAESLNSVITVEIKRAIRDMRKEEKLPPPPGPGGESEDEQRLTFPIIRLPSANGDKNEPVQTEATESDLSLSLLALAEDKFFRSALESGRSYQWIRVEKGRINLHIPATPAIQQRIKQDILWGNVGEQVNSALSLIFPRLPPGPIPPSVPSLNQPQEQEAENMTEDALSAKFAEEILLIEERIAEARETLRTSIRDFSAFPLSIIHQPDCLVISLGYGGDIPFSLTCYEASQQSEMTSWDRRLKDFVLKLAPHLKPSEEWREEVKRFLSR